MIIDDEDKPGCVILDFPKEQAPNEDALKPPRNRLIVTATKESLSGILESIKDLDSDVYIGLIGGKTPSYESEAVSVDQQFVFRHHIWQRNYNGFEIIIDGLCAVHNLVFYFLKDDYEKHCISDQSIIFQNISGHSIQYVHECYH
jgi:hypothetical protein